MALVSLTANGGALSGGARCIVPKIGVTGCADQFEREVVAGGGIRLIVRVLLAHPRKAAVAELACSALRNVAVNRECRARWRGGDWRLPLRAAENHAALVAAGAVEALKGASKTFAGTAPIMQHVAAALTSLRKRGAAPPHAGLPRLAHGG